MDRTTLECVIAVCGTAITGLNIYLNGDGISIAALFTLFGSMLGFEIAKKT